MFGHDSDNGNYIYKQFGKLYTHLTNRQLKTYTGGFFSSPVPSHVHVDFVVFPSGHGRSITDIWGWDAHEARLCYPDDVNGDIGGCSARRALKPKFY